MSKIRNQYKKSSPSLSLRGVKLATWQSSIDCFASHTRNDETASGYKKGFGLLEVLISAVIIIIILSALITIGRAAMNNNEYLAERAQAIYLAQEGIEMVRQIRDTNWIDGDNSSKWNTLNGTDVSNGNYKLAFDSVKGRWLLAVDDFSASETIRVPVTEPNLPFTRKINVVPVDASSQLLPNGVGTDLKPFATKVTATVTWTFSGQSKSVALSEILTNWRPDF